MITKRHCNAVPAIATSFQISKPKLQNINKEWFFFTSVLITFINTL